MNAENKDKLKQWLKTVAFAIALLLAALASSGLLFNAAVVQNSNSAIKDSRH